LVVVLVVVLDEAPTIDIDNVALARRSQQIEPTDSLTECDSNTLGDLLLIWIKLGNVPQLLAVLVPADNTVDHGRLARLSVAVIRADCVSFDILCIVNLHEAFVNIAALWFCNSPWSVEVGHIVRALVANLAEELSRTTAS
jgi:hypothetical protein